MPKENLKSSMPAENIISLKPFSKNELPQDPVEEVISTNQDRQERIRDNNYHEDM